MRHTVLFMWLLCLGVSVMGQEALAQAHSRTTTASITLQVASTKMELAAFSGTDGLEITLTPESAARFRAFTIKGIGRRSQLLVNGKVVTEPMINHPIVEGRVVLSGMSKAELQAVAQQLAAPGAAIVVRLK
ncbi:SecDF P1 head subdomain-containing protein [Methylocella sp. CPCC 101449]|uniref:SecDF P1 head subdomain-containing protein n=1 Tax=Methylocella sp. CPCC 101449 TaxID=2987531 RepID=UPI002891FA13|nr:hypothetical protein [Methylocella sp. CPCC 101449]MDT2021854.1 hypothetical protein [Methylocella sp. CPCC 101449]